MPRAPDEDPMAASWALLVGVVTGGFSMFLMMQLFSVVDDGGLLFDIPAWMVDFTAGREPI